MLKPTRTKVILFRLTPEEYRLVMGGAKASESRSISDYVRSVVLLRAKEMQHASK